MSKIICDICGTTYSDTADSCPICGCSRDAAAEFLRDDILADEFEDIANGKSGRYAVKKKREIFDFDEVNAPVTEDMIEDAEDFYEEEEEDLLEETSGGHNVFVVILLTILIAALLLAAGFIFFRYFLPNIKSNEETIPETTAYVEEAPVPDTTELRIPCEMLALSSGTAELTKEGQYFLMHVQAFPENTTDQIVYVSADESIATVTEDGRITAVAEGETEIIITCGNIKNTCPVVVAYEEETLPPTEPTVVETVPETTAATEPAETTVKSNVTLKLKQTDIRLGVYYEYQLLLDCDLEQHEVEWKSEHPHIATVDANGVIKAVKDGTTSIIVKYGDQEVSCIVRCNY